MDNVSQEILDILDEYYNVPKQNVIYAIKSCDLLSKGYGEPAKRGVHAMHFPEDPGVYYIILCKGIECPICNN